MPSGTVVNLEGRIARLVPAGDPGPGLELVMTKLPPSAVWMIESALGRTAPAGRGEPAGAETQLDDSGSAEAEDQLVTALEGELRAFRTMQPHQILGIAHDAGEPAARTAFGELSKRYHPDRFARFESDLARRVASDVFVVLRDAYRRMTEPSHRPAVTGPAPTRHLTPARGVRIDDAPRIGGPRSSPPPPPMPTDQHNVTSPAVPLTSPLVTFSSGKTGAGPAPTLASYRETPPPAAGKTPELSLDYLFGDLGPASKPAEGPLALEEPQLVEADRLLEIGRLDEAFAAYEDLLRANPTNRAARAGRELVHGMRKSAARDREGAAHHFELALEIEPGSDRAARELATLRRAATERGKGLLSKLLGKGGGS
jgi:hypothetical protein